MSTAPRRRHAQPSCRPVFALAALSAAVLAACGGSDDAAAPAQALAVSGVAATGAALSGAAVQANCASGTGTATSGNDGRYTITITGGALPCVLEATSADGNTVLHSVASGSTASATANITPLTSVLVAQLTGQDPAAFFDSAAGAGASALASTVTSDKIGTATTAVVATLGAAGLDTSSLGDLVGGSLVAGSGEGYDGVLDTLGTTLAASGSTLQTLVTTVAATSAAADPASAPATTSGGEAAGSGLLPAALLLKPKAAHCSALRSTAYRFIVVKASASTGSADPVTTLGTGTLDAANEAGPRWTHADGTSETMVPVEGEACRFTQAGNDGGSADVVVAPSGVVVMRSTATWTEGESALDTTARLVIALPVQNLAVSDLVGTWNTLGWYRQDGAGHVDAATATIAAGGAVAWRCDHPSMADSACTTEGPDTGFSANSEGGFDVALADGERMRAFAYRAGNGQTFIVMTHADGSVFTMTPQRTLTGPTVGDTHKAWNAQINASWVADALTYNGYTVDAVDAAGGSLTRTVQSIATGVSHPQTLMLNQARNGYVHRAAAAATGSDGNSVTVREMYSLKLGVGISAYWLPANNQAGTNARFGLSVTQP